MHRLSAGSLKADEHIKFRRLLGLQFQGDGPLTRGGKQDFPLRLHPAWLVGDDIEGEEVGKKVADQLGGLGLPHGTGRGTG